MDCLLFFVIVIQVFTGVLSASEDASDQAKSMNCLMCSTMVSTDHACVANPDKSDPDVNEQQCLGKCFVEQSTIGGFVINFKRGCDSGTCADDDSCSSLIKSGTCKKCCDDEDFCNSMGFGGSSKLVINSMLLIAMAAISKLVTMF
ncbi:uncharacterized protein LOC144450340 [Glandiceps talaboti]